jgi:hypothetical protein
VTAASVIDRSAALYRDLAVALDRDFGNLEPRPVVAGSMARIAMEHGMAILALMHVDAATSMIALLRIQYEAVVRALWLYFCATDSLLDKYAEAIDRKSLKDPPLKTITDMLAALDRDAPPTIGQMLRQLKDGAWGPMNSYVHAGILPLQLMLHGYPPDTAEHNLLNANGLTTMAAMLIAIGSGDRALTGKVRVFQLTYRDCLPPLTST